MLIVVLVSLVVVLATLVALVRLGLAHRQKLDAEAHRLQAQWLARSGADRAVAQLAADPKYTGETWDLGAADLGASGVARVEIRVEPVAGRPQRRSVHVQADFPADAVDRVRSSWQHEVDLTSGPAKPAEKPSLAPIEKPVEKPAEKPAAKPPEKSKSKS